MAYSRLHDSNTNVVIIRWNTLYADNILTVYNSQNNSINNIIHDFNILNSKLKFTTEHKTNNRVNFLDLILLSLSGEMVFHMHWKPTSTNIFKLMTFVILSWAKSSQQLPYSLKQNVRGNHYHKTNNKKQTILLAIIKIIPTPK